MWVGILCQSFLNTWTSPFHSNSSFQNTGTLERRNTSLFLSRLGRSICPSFFCQSYFWKFRQCFWPFSVIDRVLHLIHPLSDTQFSLCCSLNTDLLSILPNQIFNSGFLAYVLKQMDSGHLNENFNYMAGMGILHRTVLLPRLFKLLKITLHS